MPIEDEMYRGSAVFTFSLRMLCTFFILDYIGGQTVKSRAIFHIFRWNTGSDRLDLSSLARVFNHRISYDGNVLCIGAHFLGPRVYPCAWTISQEISQHFRIYRKPASAFTADKFSNLVRYCVCVWRLVWLFSSHSSLYICN